MLMEQCQVDTDAKLCASSPVVTDSLERIIANVLVLTKPRQHKFHCPPAQSEYVTLTA